MQDEDFFRLSPDAVALLLDLAAPAGDRPLLIAAYGGELVEAGRARGHQIVVAPGEPGITAQVETIAANGPYAGAIIAPPFNVEVDPVDVPNDWPKLRRWFAEEYLIGHAWSHLIPGARVVSLVSSGLLSLVQRQPARRALLAHGLRLVAELPNDELWMTSHNAGTYLALTRVSPS